MNREFRNLTIEDLKKQLRRETKAFLDGLESGISVADLKSIRARMKEISELLEEKIAHRGGKYI